MCYGVRDPLVINVCPRLALPEPAAALGLRPDVLSAGLRTPYRRISTLTEVAACVAPTMANCRGRELPRSSVVWCVHVAARVLDATRLEL
jgi:hypothetical protein